MIVAVILFLTFAFLATGGLGLILESRVSRRAAWIGVALSILFFIGFAWLIWTMMRYGASPMT